MTDASDPQHFLHITYPLSPLQSLALDPAEQKHANRHIARFLDLSPPPSKNLQVVSNGSLLTAQSLYDETFNPTLPIWITDSPESIGMVVPKKLTMQKLADIIGPGYPVSVIDVQHQEELEGWTLGDLVEYFEDEERLSLVRKHQQAIAPSTNRRKRRTVTTATSSPKVLNQISLEFRNTPLAAHVKSPQFVRDLDWIDHAWKSDDPRPQTQYYCLTSTAGCYTDFHVDFGGTSVWYHVLTGAKHFLVLPPTQENLRVYEDWLCRPDQSLVFLPDLISDEIQKVVLQQSQTLFIPCGWIHAVYTPTDSLVIGGNFLHGLDIPKQIDVHSLETRTRVPAKFRFPKYLALVMYAGSWYVKNLRRGKVCRREVQGLPTLLEALRQWSRVPSDPFMVKAMAEIGNIQEVLKELQEELERTERDGIGPNPKFNYADDVKPKIRLKFADTIASSPGSFRIKLSSGSQFSSMPAQTKKRRIREELDFVSSNGDDEWKPTKAVTAARAELVVVATKSQSETKPASIAKPKKPVSSRQRLMKRLR
jgi:Jumonji helical domain